MQNRRSSIGDQGLPVDWVRPCETEAPEDFPPRIPVTSTSLRSVGYNPEAHELDLEFKDGRLYRYSGVPAEVHDELLHAPSLGRYFLANVRGQYPCERLC